MTHPVFNLDPRHPQFSNYIDASVRACMCNIERELHKMTEKHILCRQTDRQTSKQTNRRILKLTVTEVYAGRQTDRGTYAQRKTNRRTLNSLASHSLQSPPGREMHWLPFRPPVSTHKWTRSVGQLPDQSVRIRQRDGGQQVA